MTENGEVWPDWPEDWAIRLCDWCRRLLICVLHIVDSTRYRPEPPQNTHPEELETLADFEIVEMDNVDDSNMEVIEAGLKEHIFSFITELGKYSVLVHP